MLRIICAVAVAAPCISYAQSSVSISGGMVAGYKYTSAKSDGTAAKRAIENLDAGGSHLTFRGDEDLGGGMKASFVLNHRFSPVDGGQTGSTFFTNTKLALSGGFGEVSMGKMWAPVDELLRRSLDVYMPLGLGTTVYGGPGDAPTRYNGMFMYVSPEMGGLRLGGAVVPKGSMTSQKQDTTEVAARYKSGALTLGAGYTRNAGNVPSAADNVKDRNVVTAGARYDFSKLNIGLTYSKVDEPLTAKDSDRYSLGARYPLSEAWTAKAGYEHLKVAKKDTTNTFALGAEYRLSKRTMFFSEVGKVRSATRSKNDTGLTMMVGMAHRF